MYIIDFILHHIPLLLFIYLEKNNIVKSEINFYEIFGIPLLYRLLFDPYKIYKIELKIQIIFLITPLILFLLYSNIYII